MSPIPFAYAAVKGQAHLCGSLRSPLTAASLRNQSSYGGMGLPAVMGLEH